jgi:hypothetical protein
LIKCGQWAFWQAVFCIKSHLNLQISTQLEVCWHQCFLQINEVEVGHFFIAMGKTGKNLAKFFKTTEVRDQEINFFLFFL